MAVVNIKPLIPNLKTTVEVPYKKVLWTYLPLLFLVVGLGLFINQAGRQQRIFTDASGGATLSLALSDTEISVGEEFSVDLILNPYQTIPAQGYLALNVMPEYMEIIDAGPTHQTITLDKTNAVKNLGTVRFKALKETEKTSILYSSETWVADENNENILNRTIGTQIKITSAQP